MSGHRIETYDVSPKAKEIIDYHYQRRLKLREEYLRECLKPIKQNLLIDSAIQRFYDMRNLHEYRLKITARGTGVAFASVFGTIAAVTYILQITKESVEHKYRTGQVRYADREFKLI